MNEINWTAYKAEVAKTMLPIISPISASIKLTDKTSTSD